MSLNPYTSGGYTMNKKKTLSVISALLAVMLLLSSLSIMPAFAANKDNLASVSAKRLVGDVDSNGKVNVRDATNIQKFLAAIIDFTDEQVELADTDGNTKVNIKDATAIQKWLAKLITDTNIGEEIAPSTEPKPTEPKPTEPKPTEPKPTEPETLPVLGEDEYYITYHIAGDDKYLQGVTVNNPNPLYYHTDTSVRLANISIDGYVFEGWYDGEGTTAEKIKEIPEGTEGDIELYARWTLKEYTIQFDSPLDKIDPLTYTVDKGATLENPEWDGYTFVGWSDDEGNVVSRIDKGTTGNITLTANWTSKRNQTIPVKTLGEPIIHEDKDLGQYLFVYEIGRIENVPLYTIKDFGNCNGLKWTETETSSGSINKTEADSITNAISNATTRTDAWTLSKDWNTSTSISKNFSNEVSTDVSKTASENFSETGKWNIGGSIGGSKTTTVEAGISAKIHSNLSTGISGSIPLDIFSIGVNNDYEFGGEVGGNVSSSRSNTKNWNINAGYEHSSTVGGSNSVSKSLSERINSEFGYGQTSSVGGSQSQSSELSTSQTESREYASSFSYGVEQTESSSIEYSSDDAYTGYYRLVCAGTLHVFAVVGFDVETSTYYTYTYTVLDKDLKKFIDYSYFTPNFDDNENGVLPFEVPYFVNEYIDTVVGGTAGLVVDIDTGIILDYVGQSNNVVIPKYISTDNGDGTYTVTEIKGIDAGAFEYNDKITSVTMGENITEIPANAFTNCTALKTVVANSVTTIGANAFMGCSSLESFSVPATVTSLGKNAFANAGKITFNPCTADIADAAAYSGAREIVLNMADIKDSYNNRTLLIGSETEHFEFNGAGKVYNKLHIVSDAKTTIINNATISDMDATPLKLSSENVTLNRADIQSGSGLAIILTADTTNLSLYGATKVFSSSANSILSRNLNLSLANASAGGTLNVLGGNVAICGTITNDNLLRLTSPAEIKYIDEATYSGLIDNTLEWILAENAPANAVIVGTRWTYDKKTTITSDQKYLEGYTMVNSTTSEGDWGQWSNWSKTVYTADSNTQVETKTVTDQAAYTNYKYWIYRTADGYGYGTKNYNTGSKHGACTKYDEINLTYPLSVTNASLGLYGNYNSSMFSHGYDCQWFKGDVTTVPAKTHVEYRFRDKEIVTTYYHTKQETVTSYVEVIPGDGITNVQKWVQCKIS